MSRVCHLTTLEVADPKHGYIQFNSKGIEFSPSGTPLLYIFENNVIGIVGRIKDEVLTNQAGYGRLEFEKDIDSQELKRKYESGQLALDGAFVQVLEMSNAIATKWKVNCVYLVPKKSKAEKKHDDIGKAKLKP
ncbi:MAG: hypothetical protein ACK56W_19230 [Pirellula sp.]|jgi:hypothetical protein|nr:hypothetical protein [Pirellula sp.]